MGQYRKPHTKKITYRELEKKLDRIFSEYIRLEAADDNGYCQCITCGKIYYWKDIHNGHFISRSIKATRFNEINCHPQCIHCNSFKQGEWLKYEQRLIEIYGKDEVNKLKHLAQIGGSDDMFSLQIKIFDYKEKVKQIKGDKNL